VHPETGLEEEHPYPDPTTGEFMVPKDPERAATSAIALDASGREVKIDFLDEVNRLQCIFSPDCGDGLYSIIVMYKDGTWKRTNICLLR
jgi:hypothetical protein